MCSISWADLNNVDIIQPHARHKARAGKKNVYHTYKVRDCILVSNKELKKNCVTMDNQLTWLPSRGSMAVNRTSTNLGCISSVHSRRSEKVILSLHIKLYPNPQKDYLKRIQKRYTRIMQNLPCRERLKELKLFGFSRRKIQKSKSMWSIYIGRMRHHLT